MIKRKLARVWLNLEIKKLKEILYFGKPLTPNEIPAYRRVAT